jgi:hypothetical protein
MIKSGNMRWAGHVARLEDMRNAHNILVGKPKWKRPLGRLRCRWKSNNRIDPRQIMWEVVDWIHVAQDMHRWWALVKTVKNFQLL